MRPKKTPDTLSVSFAPSPVTAATSQSHSDDVRRGSRLLNPAQSGTDGPDRRLRVMTGEEAGCLVMVGTQWHCLQLNTERTHTHRLEFTQIHSHTHTHTQSADSGLAGAAADRLILIEAAVCLSR